MGYRDVQPDPRYFNFGGAFMGGYNDAIENKRRQELVDLEKRQQGFYEQRYADQQSQMQQQAQAQALQQEQNQQVYAEYFKSKGLDPRIAMTDGADELFAHLIEQDKKGSSEEGYTLSPGSGRYGPDGKLINQQPFAPPNDRIVMMGGGLSAVDPRSHEITPLTTLQQERDAAAAMKSAEASASAQAQAGVEGTQKAVAQNAALGLWDQALSGLREGLAGTETGPIAGRIPAFTGAQQKAESAVAALAPVLKQIFRVAGEGTFTDRDQAMLLDMIPTRKVDESVREDVIANIDSIVRAKLNSAQAFQVGGKPAEDKFIVGKTYKDANGNTAKYLGNGKWQ